MDKSGLISVLQGRITRRKKLIREGWASFNDDKYLHDKGFLKNRIMLCSLSQKEDKQCLKYLIGDERRIKDIEERLDTTCRALGILAGMRDK